MVNLTSSPKLRAGMAAGALATIALATPLAAEARERPFFKVTDTNLHVRTGSHARVAGSLPHGTGPQTVLLQVRRGGRWHTIDRDRTDKHGRYRLRARVGGAQSAPVRVAIRGGRHARRQRALGRLNVYRYANASWYGPGLYGNRLGCGGTLTPGTLGVAHKSLPCGTMVTFRLGGRSVRVPVIDRGPYVGGREYDLTAATAQRLGFHGHGAVLATH